MLQGFMLDEEECDQILKEYNHDYENEIKIKLKAILYAYGFEETRTGAKEHLWTKVYGNSDLRFCFNHANGYFTHNSQTVDQCL